MQTRDKDGLNSFRVHLTKMHSGKGYKTCPLCGCPIRPVIWLDAQGRLLHTGKERGGAVHLRKMCEVCWRESRGLVGDVKETESFNLNLEEVI